MATKQYITFRWQNLYYAIEATLVQEIFPLPELKIIPVAPADGEKYFKAPLPVGEGFRVRADKEDMPPADVIGLLNLRGQLVPMLHLNGRQGRTFPLCQISDSVILLQGENFPIGLVVHQISDVLELDTKALVKETSNELIDDVNPDLIAGVAKLDRGNLILIESQKIICQPDAILALIRDEKIQVDGMVTSSIHEANRPLKQESRQQTDEVSNSKTPRNFYELYCPHATLEEREIFRQRADNLKQPIEGSTVTEELMSIAVVGLGNEYFGLDLGLVREFTEISNLTPIPCCPNHIVGNMNLRGEIVTLVDIRNALNLPTVPINVGSQAVVIQVDDIVAGLPVDRVLEMAYINPTELTQLSEIVPNSEGQYLRGTTVFQEKTLRVVDLHKLFTQGDLVVNE